MLSWQGRLLKLLFRLWRLPHLTGALTVERGRATLEALAARLRPASELRCTPASAGGVPAEWILPPGASAMPVVVYLHGGGYCAGSLSTHRHLAANIAQAAGARVLMVDYRLAPEHPFPSAVEDAQAAYGWLLAEGVAPGQVVLAGDSAGGGLALATAIALRDGGQPLPAAIACLSPWTDLSLSGESLQTNAGADLVVGLAAMQWAASLYLGDADPCTPLASPLHAELAGLPPLLIQVAADEMLLSDSVILAAQAQAAGVDVTLEIWDGMQHVWQFAARYLPEGQRAVDRIGAFVAARCPSGGVHDGA
jgi:acetyl esterase/lipase